MNNPIIIAIDAMGGDNSPDKVIEGVSLHSKSSKDVIYKIFGNKSLITPLIDKYDISNDRYDLIHTEKVVEGEDSALSAAKRGKETSLWLAVESLKHDNAHAIVSAGNTGALFLISKLNLKMIKNIDKPALSALWPSKQGMNVVLDLGANIDCNSKNLIDFSIMGSALLKALFDNIDAKVALLNIGSEELKGNAMIKDTYKILNDKKFNLFEFKGYIEGNHIMDGDVNVIVADGFTGNIALKTAEGTSNFIISELKKALSSNLIGKFSSLLNYYNLKKFKKKLDPRLYNGAILLGLDKPVIKSHGSTDCVGFANSLKVCEKTIRGNLIDQIKNNIT
jgi:glycerol-3-phosphate acyltransferase PlsX